MGAFSTTLGKDKLVVSRFEGTEALSELFEYRLEVVSDDNDVDFDRILGTKCRLDIQSHHEGVSRNFNGVLVEAQWIGRDQDLRYYRLVLRPWLWLLTRTTNCKIFSHQTVPQILAKILSDRGFVQFEQRLSQSYPQLEYCVQYRESDFAFMSRLMEEYGIYYYFEHDEADHKLIMVDSGSAHQPKSGGAPLEFAAVGLDNNTGKDRLNEWSEGRRLRSGKVTLDDYDYEKPSTDLMMEKAAAVRYQHGDLELYDFPGRYTEKGDGSSLAEIRLEAEQAVDKRVLAGGDAVTCCPGFTMTLDGSPPASKGMKFLILRANHLFRAQAFRSTDASGDEGYSGSYEFQPIDIPFRAPATTPKPVIHGPQTALVVSDVDDECRLEVRFFWDRDNSQSRYVRIAQSWAGNGWGDVKIPRIGMEVVVDYLNGDPDYPLVTGSVYNAENVAPYVKDKLNAVSGTKTQTLNGSGYNELIMDDTAGSELIRFHAQHDLEGKVENDERREIGQNVKVDIGNSRDESIMSTWTVKANEKIEFTVGQSTFTMTPVGITLKSTLIALQADALLQLQSNALGQLTTAAPLTIQGALVLIN